jgi:hypothetical protein
MVTRQTARKISPTLACQDPNARQLCESGADAARVMAVNPDPMMITMRVMNVRGETSRRARRARRVLVVVLFAMIISL